MKNRNFLNKPSRLKIAGVLQLKHDQRRLQAVMTVFGRSALNLPVFAYRFGGAQGGAAPRADGSDESAPRSKASDKPARPSLASGKPATGRGPSGKLRSDGSGEGGGGASAKAGVLPAKANVLILGGVHGDEPEGVYIACGLLRDWTENFPYKALDMTLIPIFNPDGVFTAQRLNGSQTDLNRNLPTKDWSPKAASPRYRPGPAPCSESENQALVRWIEERKPDLIISLHSYEPQINVNGDCRPEADILARETGYRISDYIGYSTPGSLGDYCGRERGVPVITYEAERGSPADLCLSLHVPAIKKALYETEKRAATPQRKRFIPV